MDDYLLSEDDERGASRADAKRWQRVQTCRRLIPNFDRYFESRLHDSNVLTAELFDDRLVITLDDLSVQDLAQACSSTLGLESADHRGSMPPFPVRLVFHELRAVQLFDEYGGRLRRKFNVRQALKFSESYEYDSFAQITPTRILVGLVLWGRRTRTTRFPARLLEVDCARLEILEEQRKPFVSRLGPGSGPLFDCFMRVGRPWDLTQPENWRKFYDDYCAVVT